MKKKFNREWINNWNILWIKIVKFFHMLCKIIAIQIRWALNMWLLLNLKLWKWKNKWSPNTTNLIKLVNIKILWMLIKWHIQNWTILRKLPICRLNLLIQKIKKIWINIALLIVEDHKHPPTFRQRVHSKQNVLPCLILLNILLNKIN